MPVNNENDELIITFAAIKHFHKKQHLDYNFFFFGYIKYVVRVYVK